MAVAGLIGAAFGVGASMLFTTGAVIAVRKLNEKEKKEILEKFTEFGKLEDIRIEKEFKRMKYLGGGSFGEVYAWQKKKWIGSSDVYFAVKEVTLENVSNRSMLLDETDKLSKLQHENVVEFYKSVIDISIGKVFLFTELLVTSVGDIVRKKKISEDDARIMTRDILDGLIYIHGRGIIHCDIKGDNILLDSKGTAKLADFGISRFWANNSAGKTKFFKGSLPYMSPELIDGNPPGKRSDLWSVGCTVIEMLNQKPPALDEAITLALKQIQSLNHRKIVELMGASDVKNFLLDIFVVLDKRPYPEELREHDWLKKGGASELSLQLIKRINGEDDQLYGFDSCSATGHEPITFEWSHF